MPIILDPTTPEAVGDAIPLSELIRKVRREMRDWPDEDDITLATDDAIKTVKVADASKYFVNQTIEIDYESMIVRAAPSGTTLTVKRGAFGSTPSAHVNGASVLAKPRFPSVQIIDVLNDAVQATYPYVYRKVIDTSLVAETDAYEYPIPLMFLDLSQAIRHIYRVDIKESGDLTYWPLRQWRVIRGAQGSQIRLARTLPAGTSIRVFGCGPFPLLSSSADQLDAAWPRNLEYPLVDYACSCLLASGEYGRVALDRGAIDEREQANKVGASMNASDSAYQRFMYRVQRSGFPPMPVHAIKAF